MEPGNRQHFGCTNARVVCQPRLPANQQAAAETCWKTDLGQLKPKLSRGVEKTFGSHRVFSRKSPCSISCDASISKAPAMELCSETSSRFGDLMMSVDVDIRGTMMYVHVMLTLEADFLLQTTGHFHPFSSI